ncbi:MAG: dipeptidase [Gammaproteobacteria bacterium]|nr:dipeptidase [Gammaproteobacteria bacterium]
MTAAEQFTAANLDRFLAELFDFLRIPSISAKSEHNGDTRDAAGWLRDRMRDIGLEAEILETPRHPVVLGEWRGAGEDAPTVLVYGHYDVQPAEPLELWTAPAFEPDVRDGRIYARGSADDKGQLFLHVKAAESLLAADGRLPVNLIVLAEGEEEIGSPNLIPFVEAHAERLACDVVVISDSAMFAPGLPSVLFSLRGLAYFEITVHGPAGDLHSGSYGGGVVNPAMALARILGTLHDDRGHIAIPGFYDDVVDWGEETRAEIRALPFDDEEFREGVGVAALSGEAGYSTLERLWIRPTCEVNGLLSGYTGEGAKTVLPAHSMAKVSFRLVPDQDPARVAELLRAHIARVGPPEVRVEIEELHGGMPWRGQVSGGLIDAASRALARSFGRPPVLTGEGGSIPIVGEFERILEAPVLLLGFALPGANMHAPDEWFPLENFDKGIVALAALLEELGSGAFAS